MHRMINNQQGVIITLVYSNSIHTKLTSSDVYNYPAVYSCTTSITFVTHHNDEYNIAMYI